MNKLLHLLTFLTLTIQSFAQMSTEITPTTFTLPRITSLQRDGLNAVKGQLIFNTTTNKMEFFNGTIWVSQNNGQGDYVNLTDNQIIQGNKTFTNDLVINGISVGIGNDTTSIIFGNKISNINQGKYNISIGKFSLNSNKEGKRNISIGYESLKLNDSGSDNISIGYKALQNNKFSYAGTLSSWVCNWNIGIGSYALFSNTRGFDNIAIGYKSLYSNIVGYDNIAIGEDALKNSKGDLNIGIGYSSGTKIIEGSYNTIIGTLANVTASDSYNAIAIGFSAQVNASNKVRIGNSSINMIEGQVAWSNPSDRRLKENIQYTKRLGLEFIKKLQTVSYNYIADQNKVRYDGFIAQDILQIIQDLNIPFSGIKKSDDGTYSLAYSDFIMPVVNAIQEQQLQIQELKAKNLKLEEMLKEIDEIKKTLSTIKRP